MSQFHWHATDSQSFPLQIPGFTDLSAKGAYEPSMIYTPKDVKEIVDYAGAVRFDFIRPTQLILKFGRSQRGIDVMVEIDTPGHTAIFAEAHPEYIACPQATPWASYANGMGISKC